MPKKKFLSRDEILSNATLRTREIERPSGGLVRLREFTGTEAQKVLAKQAEKELTDTERQMRFLALVIVHSLVDEKNVRLLEGTDEEIDAVVKWPARDITAIGNASLELNGLTDEAKKALEKN